MSDDKCPPEEDFIRLFEETLLKRNPFQDPQTIREIDFNSFKADATRSLIAQIDFFGRTNRISPSCSQEIQKHLIDDYRAIVDDPKGLNNYSEEALAICNHRKNESSEWKSSLSALSGKELVEKYGKNMKPRNQSTTQYDNLYFKDLEKLKVKRTADDTINRVKKGFPDQPLAIEAKSGFIPSKGSSLNQNNPQYKLDKQKQLFVSENTNLNNKPYHQTLSSASSSKRKKELECDEPQSNLNSFKTAKDVWVVDQQKKNNQTSLDYGSNRKTLGTRPSGLTRKFIPPVANSNNNKGGPDSTAKYGQERDPFTAGPTVFQKGDKIFEFDPEKVKNVDPKMLEVMINEILDDGPPVTWDDIAGLEFAKKTIQEIVVWPLLRPDIFKGLRGPPKGILLFGPPGTGKTLIGKCIASQSKSTFFSISASSLTSKWIGEGEKLVRALFVVARILQPSVVFIDEIDSLLSQRGSDEHESSRRLKTEFLVQLDGAATSSDDRILIVGATNRPQELDEAARRRLVKRLYIPLPEGNARKTIVTQLLSQLPHSLSSRDLDLICEKTEGYSGADMANLCKEAALGPLRELNFEDIESIPSDQLRHVMVKDFISALSQVRASVCDADLEIYLKWNKDFGSTIIAAK